MKCCCRGQGFTKNGKSACHTKELLPKTGKLFGSGGEVSKNYFFGDSQSRDFMPHEKLVRQQGQVILKEKTWFKYKKKY
ncbi:MAG: hypothetical protein CMH48_11735 [Muricauda sp.]|nr:hypothetical protein [Allomuricauda sp.]MBC31502.1 hypothetical protein [Allomuricauda sp.]